jgi:PAS domain S-box-containing protein
LRVKTEPALWREGVTDSRNRESLRLLAASLDSISDAVSITNDEHLFVYANQSFLRLYGYRRDEVLAHLDLMLNFSTVSQTLVDEVRTYTALGGWHGQLNNRHKTGKGVAVALRTSVLRDARGLFLGHLGIAAPQARRERSLRRHFAGGAGNSAMSLRSAVSSFSKRSVRIWATTWLAGNDPDVFESLMR